MPISGNDVTPPYQERARDQESEEAREQRLARVRDRRRQRLASEKASSDRRVWLTDRRSAETPEERETRVVFGLPLNAVLI